MPVFEADYVFLLASKTGWAEDFLRWRLPLSRGWAYWHAAVLQSGTPTRWPGEVNDWWSSAKKLFVDGGL